MVAAVTASRGTGAPGRAGPAAHRPADQVPRRAVVDPASASVVPGLVPAGVPPMLPHFTASTLVTPRHSAEDFLVAMLTGMDVHMQQVRGVQQGLVATVELACRRALGQHFARLALVGSAALGAETPGSDVDVVCFTRRDGPEHSGSPVVVLRRVHRVLKEQSTMSIAGISTELIDDARVPILRVAWRSPGQCLAVDVSVDQKRPVDHVAWFQRVGAAPGSKSPPPAAAPLVTLTLRCVKWWLRQRQIPTTKEGGLPTIAWLLMAVHVCSLPETHQKAITGSQRPMEALLASLSAFFRHYSEPGCLYGILQFAPDGTSSELRRSNEHAVDAWSDFAVLDPTRQGSESLNLAPSLPPATQLLLAYELRRADDKLEQVHALGETSVGESRRLLCGVFEGLPSEINALPSFLHSFMGVLLLWGEDVTGCGARTVELGILDHVVRAQGGLHHFSTGATKGANFMCGSVMLTRTAGDVTPAGRLQLCFAHATSFAACPSTRREELGVWVQKDRTVSGQCGGAWQTP
eukprot:CAMPEP_0172726150 /NCGR_PEP_ID=MMETSP1074-20121228/90020_1 /TAXON_ID=2916 /ORGANISM="Ceratium fusus, Strain PA161109" /LENGTH=520 /DNA_ID=CAMNT_0013553087 /DNA_START=41 /DNA_END=1604 /DNA_ORIENTATION=-